MTLQYETACNKIRDDIAALLLGPRSPTTGSALAAARATRDVADAMHHAAGRPNDALWANAVVSLRRFLELCGSPSRATELAPLLELRRFVEENADLLPPELDKAA